MKDQKEEVKERNVRCCAYSHHGLYENASKRPISTNEMEGMYWCEIAYRLSDLFFSHGAVAVSAGDAPELLRDPGVEVIDNLYKREVRNSGGTKEIRTICAFKDKETFERAIARIDSSDTWNPEEQALVFSDEAADDEETRKKREKAACDVAAIIIDNNQERGMSDLTARQALLLKRCAEILSDFHDNNREGHIREVCEYMLSRGGIIMCNELGK